MADPLTDPVVITVVLAGVALAIAVAYFEMKFIHKRMKNRRVRAAKQDSNLPDEAHNAHVTAKAILTKEVPPNFPQSKFSIQVAGGAIEQARSSGRDVVQATELLEAAKGRFDAKDYDGALTMARLSARSAEGKKVEMPAAPSKRAPTTAIVSNRACPSCGAPLRADDVFCRKCGTRLVPSSCPSCGASLLADDSFCPKCGKPVSQ